MNSLIHNSVNQFNNEDNRVDIINIVLIMVSVMLIVLPLGVNINIPNTIRVYVVLLWYMDCLIRHSRSLSQLSGFCFACLAIILFEFLYLYIGYSSAGIGNYYNTIIYYDIIIKSCYVMFAYSLRARVLLFRLIQVYVMIICYINGIYGSTLERLYEQSGLLGVLNEMGSATTPTEFYNMLIFGVSANFYMLINEKKITYKVLDFFAIVAALFFMFSYHTRATSLFLMILLSALIYINRKTTSFDGKKIFKSALGLGLVAILIMYFVGNFVVEILPDRVAERVQAMMDLASGEGEGADSDYLARFKLNMISINTWLSTGTSTFFGIGNHLGRDYYGTIGQHAFYIDYLAKYGIFGMILIIISLKSFLKTSKRFTLNNKEYFTFMMFFIVYISLGFIAKSAFGIIALGAFLYSLLAISTVQHINNTQK